MNDYAKHPEQYELKIVHDDSEAVVTLTYPQVARLGKILSSIRTEGVDNECTIISSDDTNCALAITRLEVPRNDAD